jgi:lysophospholipase L1-like esterase
MAARAISRARPPQPPKMPPIMLALAVTAPALFMPSSPKDVLWLPLGDSITWGCGTDAAPRGAAGCVKDAGGYRVPLAWSMSQSGYNVSTMGTLVTGPAYVPSQWTHHEGHPGWRYDQIDELLNKSFATSAQPPDLITIHLGTNDCGQKLTVPTIEKNANLLLTHIYEKAPRAMVYMASMIGFPGVPVCSQAFNKLVPGIVDDHAKLGMNITYVPMETSGVCVDKSKDTPVEPLSGLCCKGEVHPTAAGYLRMASVFALSIAEGPGPKMAM